MDTLLKVSLFLLIFIFGLIAGRSEKHLKPSHVKNLVLFNTARLISYFISGSILGLIGFLIKVNGFSGGILLFIFSFGVFIVALTHMTMIPSLLILGLHEHHHPKSSFAAGIINIFASSATLHIVMIISIAHGYFLESGFIMASFALGSLYLPNKKIYKHNRLLDSVKVLLFLLASFIILNKGLLYTQLYHFSPFENFKKTLVPEVIGNYQYLKTNIGDLDKRVLIGNEHELNWMIDGNNSGDTIYIPEFRHKSRLDNGSDFLSIKPQKKKFIYFTLGFGKGDHVIRIIDNIEDVYNLPYRAVFDSGFGNDLKKKSVLDTEYNNRPNIVITDPGIAEVNDQTQSIDISITQSGFNPSIIILKKGVPATINFIGDELTDENYRIVMPSFNEYLEFTKGNNPILISSPLVDFSFYSWKGEHGGYILVVDDLEGMTKDKAMRQIKMLNINGI